MFFKGEIRAALGWIWSDGAVDNQRLDYAASWAGGNGPDQAEAVWHCENQALANGVAATLDLAALARTVLGDLNHVGFVAVKALLAINHSPGGGSLLVGGAETEAWSGPFGAAGDRVHVPPGSPLLVANRGAGWAVDAANRNLRLAAVGGDVVYSIAILGTVNAQGT